MDDVAMKEVPYEDVTRKQLERLTTDAKKAIGLIEGHKGPDRIAAIKDGFIKLMNNTLRSIKRERSDKIEDIVNMTLVSLYDVVGVENLSGRKMCIMTGNPALFSFEERKIINDSLELDIINIPRWWIAFASKYNKDVIEKLLKTVPLGSIEEQVLTGNLLGYNYRCAGNLDVVHYRRYNFNINLTFSNGILVNIYNFLCYEYSEDLKKDISLQMKQIENSFKLIGEKVKMVCRVEQEAGGRAMRLIEVFS